MTSNRNRVVLLFSGREGAVAALRLLVGEQAEVVTLTLDLGQRHELTAVRERALQAGAVRAHVLDAREEFASKHVWPAVHGGLRRTAQHLPALMLPLIAERLVEVARIESAGAVAHALSGKEAAHLERLVARLAGDLEVKGPAPHAGERVTDGGTLWASELLSAAAGGFRLTCDPSDAADAPATLEIGFDAGRPVRVNGVDMPLVELIESVETIAGAHGVGRLTVAADRIIEAPAAFVLEAAWHALVDAGGALTAATVRLRLSRGACDVLSCQASDSGSMIPAGA